jgi:CRISPR/Cas system-associated protein Cas10 (large subunit of type III CRISPR-Cas system)
METRNKAGQFLRGKKHPNWKGGFNMKEYRKKYYSLPENKERQRLAGANRRKNKPEEIAKYRREHTLATRKKMYTSVTKRSYPEGNRCELCKKEKRLVYHHWDDSQLKKGSSIVGLWLCNRCHQLAESLDEDKNLGKVYLKIRQKTEGWDSWGNEIKNDIELTHEKEH